MDESPADTYVSSVALRADFDVAWKRLSDPYRLPSLFPNWITDVTATAEGFEVTVDGEVAPLAVEADRDLGVIDYRLDASGRTRRSRLLGVDGGCVLSTVVSRPAGSDDATWIARKRNLDADLGTARRMIESDAGPLPADHVGARSEGEQVED